MWVLDRVYVGYLSPVSDALFTLWLVSAMGVCKLVLVKCVFLPLGHRFLPRHAVDRTSFSLQPNASPSSTLMRRDKIAAKQSADSVDPSRVSLRVKSNLPRLPTRRRQHVSSDDETSPVLSDASKADALATPSVDSRLLRKFVISCWKTTVYVLLIVSGGYLVSDRLFIYRTRELWTDWPTVRETGVTMKVFYLGELSFYLEELGALYIEPKMKDQLEMLIHHIVTILLIFGSYVFGFWKIGLCIMLLHDISDPLLELAKLALYCQHRTIANTLFVLFAVVFVVSRCVYLPLKVLRSC